MLRVAGGRSWTTDRLHLSDQQRMAGILEPQGLRRICCTKQARWLERMAHVRHYTSGSWGSTPFSQTHDHEVVNCAAEFGRGRDVRFGSNADMCTAASDVRYKAENYDGANPDAATATGQTARATPIFNLIALRQFIYAHEQTI
jgi:hypothetical protein